MKTSTAALVAFGFLGSGAGALTFTSAHADTGSGERNRVGFDFAGLEDKKYRVGDTLESNDMKIQFKEFRMPGGQASGADESQLASPTNTSFANGDKPELRMFLINAQVMPDEPLRKVTLKFAQNKSSQLVNLQINDDKRVSTNGLQWFHNKLVGGVRVSVQKASSGAGAFPGGTLELAAAAGKIKTFAVGGVQLFVDDVEIVK